VGAEPEVRLMGLTPTSREERIIEFGWENGMELSTDIIPEGVPPTDLK